MKKQYISPSMECVKIHAVSMLADSLTKDKDTIISDNGDVLSRGFFDFDDEDEE